MLDVRDWDEVTDLDIKTSLFFGRQKDWGEACTVEDLLGTIGDTLLGLIMDI
jgi:hypothetical protein